MTFNPPMSTVNTTVTNSTWDLPHNLSETSMTPSLSNTSYGPINSPQWTSTGPHTSMTSQPATTCRNKFTVFYKYTTKSLLLMHKQCLIQFPTTFHPALTQLPPLSPTCVQPTSQGCHSESTGPANSQGTRPTLLSSVKGQRSFISMRPVRQRLR